MEDREFDYINVIPLVDVMLVLLTIVLTTSTFIATGMISLSLPKASHGRAENLRWQTISVDQTGRIYFNRAEVALGGLGAAVDRLDRKRPWLSGRTATSGSRFHRRPRSAERPRL